MDRIPSDFCPIIFQTDKVLPSPQTLWHNEQYARLICNLINQAHQVLFTSESETSTKYSPLAGLDKTQHPYNDKWSCPIPPKENRLKVRIEAGEKNFKA